MKNIKQSPLVGAACELALGLVLPLPVGRPRLPFRVRGFSATEADQLGRPGPYTVPDALNDLLLLAVCYSEAHSFSRCAQGRGGDDGDQQQTQRATRMGIAPY